MSVILEGQQLEVDNLLSFRGKISQLDLNQIFMDMKNHIEGNGARCVGHPITVTFGIFNEDGENKIDIEALVPINTIITGNSKFSFKSKLKVVNAVVVKHVGDANRLNTSCAELNQYIMDKQLVPITGGYNVTTKVEKGNINDTEIDVYVGINPNIL